MKTFSFDIDKMAVQLLPWFARTPKTVAFVKTICAPLKTMYASFLISRQSCLYDATIDSTVIRLTKALQDKFNDATIYLLHPNDSVDDYWVYLNNNNVAKEFDYQSSANHTPVEYDYLSTVYNNQADFVIRIPVALANQADAIGFFAAKYVFSGITFIIETF